ncbi:hypothetical protein [Aneurinibacillus aneurinilyticus]|uniref:hypothetical protein n=1 Tax=Aneurinibacillus aneurinilyticus TaxID=1391 RepID=UPI003526B3C4
MIIHKVEERRCTRRRVPSFFSHKEETRPLCGATRSTQYREKGAFCHFSQAAGRADSEQYTFLCRR